jgi:putative transposase
LSAQTKFSASKFCRTVVGSLLRCSGSPDQDHSMMRRRFSEEQVIGMLIEHEAVVSVADLCRMHGISDAGTYKGKAKFGGMNVWKAKKTLEDENTRLTELLADALLYNAILKDFLGRKQ